MNPSSDAPAGDQPRVVLFVDGDPAVRAEYLEHASLGGYEAVTAVNATEGLRLFEERSPDCVVTDLSLPGAMSGADFVAVLRRKPLGAAIPILAASPGAKSLRGVTDAVIGFDVDDYVEKPLHGERLMWRIGELIRGRPIGLVARNGGVLHDPLRPVMLARGVDFLQGSLSETDPATLFFSFFATTRSGKLVVMHEKRVRVVWFRRGYPVFAESNEASEEIGARLQSRGLVDPTELEETRTEWNDVERSLGVMLMARGAVSARTWFKELRESVVEATHEIFGWTEGHYYLEYHPDASSYDAPETVSTWRSPAWFVVEGIRRHYSPARCRALFKSSDGPLKVSDSAHFILRELEDPYYFENLFVKIDGRIPARDLMQRSPFSSDAKSLAALAALWVVGALVEEVSDATRREALANPEAQAIRKAVASVSKEHPSRRAARSARVEERVRAARKQPPKPVGVDAILGTLDAVSSEVHFEQGLRFFGDRQLRDALRSFRRAAELAPEVPEHHIMVGQTALMFDDSGPEELSLAVNSLQRAVAMAPSNGAAHHWLGTALYRLGYRDRAYGILRRAAELGSEHQQETATLLELFPGA
ncbi:MAG: response regulator [Deltaproteobacteria bacterium]|nr:response regulator [Deltaproteobacteria bacterium]